MTAMPRTSIRQANVAVVEPVGLEGRLVIETTRPTLPAGAELPHSASAAPHPASVARETAPATTVALLRVLALPVSAIFQPPVCCADRHILPCIGVNGEAPPRVPD